MPLNVRHVRRVTLAVLAVAVAYVGWLLWKVDRRPSAAVREERVDATQLPSKPQEEMGCFDDFVADLSGDRIEAGRLCKQPDGFTQLERVTLTVRHDDGTTQMVIRAQRARTSEEPGQPIHLTGDVKVETPDGLQLLSQELRYDKQAEVIRSDSPVTFTRGDLSGEGGRLIHDRKNGLTQLEIDPVLRISGERTKGRDVTLIGQRLDFDQARRTLKAQGSGLLEFPEGTIEGSSIDVLLAEAAEEVRSIVSSGAAATKTVAGGGGTGGPGPPVERVLRAQRITHDFAPGGVIDRVAADGGAVLQGQSVDPAAGITEMLDGTRLDIDFAGSEIIELAGLSATGAPAHFRREEPGARREVTGNDLRLTSGASGFERLEVKGAADVRDETGPARRSVKGDNATIGFAPGGMQLQSLRFDGRPGRLTESAGDGTPPRTIAATTGDLRFDGGGRPVSGQLDGDVEIVDAGTRASADSATLQQSPRRTILKGDAAVETASRTTHGDEIVRDDDARTLDVRGNQHTLVRDQAGIPGMASTEGDEPILISSDTLLLREKERTALYEGGRPSLRRGDTELVADSLLLNEAGTLDAIGGVTSRLRLADPGSAKQASESPIDPTRLVDGRADEFHYRRAERLVQYLGEVSLKQEDTVLTSDRVDIRLTPGEPAQVESLEAFGDAFFRAPARGEAEGEKIRWLAADDSFRVHGGARPARALDADGNFQTGAVVEMTRSGVRALSSPTGRARGSSPALKAPEP